MVRRTQAIPATKEHLVSDEEKAERDLYASNADSLYHDGIRVGEEGFYDPNAGADKHPLPERNTEATPILATDPGQPKIDSARMIARESSPVLDKSELGVLRSSGRKAKTGDS